MAILSSGCFGREIAGTPDAARQVEEIQVTNQLLEKQIQELNGEARDTARQLGRQALPPLLGRYPYAPARGRALILECLAEVKGEEAVQTLLRALQDPEPDVRNTAIGILQSVNSPSATEPLIVMALYSPHARVRGETARILGRMGATSAVPQLRMHLTDETDPEAARNAGLALARLDDGPERAPFLEKLADPNPRTRYQAVADIEYINDPRLIPRLIPLLRDEEQIVNLGLEQWPVWHRVCDRAVDAIAAISRKALPFPVGRRNYLKSEIEQARQLAKQFGK